MGARVKLESASLPPQWESPEPLFILIPGNVPFWGERLRVCFLNPTFQRKVKKANVPNREIAAE